LLVLLITGALFAAVPSWAFASASEPEGSATGTWVSVVAAPVADEAAEEAEEAEAVNPLIPNPGEFFPQLIGFILLLVILAKFGWPTIINMLDKRVTTIRESLEKAEDAKVESERLLAEHKAQLDDAKKQAAQIVSDAKQAADAVKAEITATAQAEAEAIIAKARLAIESEKKAAIAQLQSSVADLSVSVAGRLISQDLSDADHRRVIEHYLAEAGSLDAN
jgi:F-type H+-transporting ATPase subunit b